MSERESGAIRINWAAGSLLVSLLAAAVVYGANANRISTVEMRLSEEIAISRQAHIDFQKAISEDSKNIATLQAEFISLQRDIEALLSRRFPVSQQPNPQSNK